MSLSPNVASAGRFIGHRRGRSSAVDIRISDLSEPQEKTLEHTQPLLEDEKYDRSSPGIRPRNNTVWAVLWLSSLVLTSILTCVFTRLYDSRSTGGFETGFPTELRGAHQAIDVHQQHFHGSLDFNGHHGFVPAGSPSLKYMGYSADVDAAWEELSKDRYFLLSDQEAIEAYGANPSQYWNVHHGGYVAGLDVLHSLHCANHLRMSLYPKVYPQDPTDGTMHKAHCVDHLRQLLMCNADLTAVPTIYYPGLQRNYINSSRPHTCRDFSKVRAWASDRYNGSNAVQPRNRDGTPRQETLVPWSP